MAFIGRRCALVDGFGPSPPRSARLARTPPPQPPRREKSTRRPVRLDRRLQLAHTRRGHHHATRRTATSRPSPATRARRSRALSWAHALALSGGCERPDERRPRSWIGRRGARSRVNGETAALRRVSSRPVSTPWRDSGCRLAVKRFALGPAGRHFGDGVAGHPLGRGEVGAGPRRGRDRDGDVLL